MFFSELSLYILSTTQHKGAHTMDEFSMENQLMELLSETDFTFESERDDVEVEVVEVDSFEDKGILTKNVGVVLKFSDGSEFQITINQSKDAD